MDSIFQAHAPICVGKQARESLEQFLKYQIENFASISANVFTLSEAISGEQLLWSIHSDRGTQFCDSVMAEVRRIKQKPSQFNTNHAATAAAAAAAAAVAIEGTTTMSRVLDTFTWTDIEANQLYRYDKTLDSNAKTVICAVCNVFTTDIIEHARKNPSSKRISKGELDAYLVKLHNTTY